ncbi:MAG: DedA family protein [Rubrivivax sp.]
MAQWIISFIEQHGYLGIAALMVLENVFPPIPSELIMPFAGFSAARGELSLAGVLAAGTVGSLLGTLPWYVAGRSLTGDRLKRWAGRWGRWLAVSPDDIDHASDWFERHGSAAVFFGRMVPAVRSVISVPAGIARMNLAAFLAWSAAGSLLWVGLLVGLGYGLESQYARVQGWLSPVTMLIVAAIIVAYLWRVLTFKPQKP